ncbi:MAG: peptide-methionine (S)-S-oxide reductase [Gammaproteobacteria bacterium CG11_big_fil_rev_8_21_14_0_20_46_22]|nr:MAG: peptide-methionine (S)-S-oxide reductase [Gammaproteobacteria bacterium CG12_big_fil_rev_8_21_14_0_65_46_12]PIR11221.1 MAG: peptide-methionine (S)-S-oxide reductase [Gammaproteobacteria bacterium CG11_big_fil_rev_8_21_14_0_20_46_22]
MKNTKRYWAAITIIAALPLLAKAATAIFAGGCFWCMQSDFDKLKGVTKTVVGYDGGTRENPNYELVSSGATRYAEAIKVTYNPRTISYAQLLTYFWRHVDPTVKNQQFCDHGSQYRTAIFYINAEQKKTAETSKQATARKLGKTVYTDITPSTHFYPAEKYHQDYYKKNPIRYKFYRWNCGRDQRLEKIWHEK